jgi:hypothetical protein
MEIEPEKTTADILLSQGAEAVTLILFNRNFILEISWERSALLKKDL